MKSTSPIVRRFLSRCIVLIVVLTAAILKVNAAEQPNVLVIMADDCTHSDLPLYGGKNAKTPNLDALAKQSLVFNRAYLCSAMCQPCRAELYTGLYPMSNGCAWNHSASRKGTKSLPHYLEASGYRIGLAGKVHVSPREVFPFENVGGFDKSCVRNPTQTHDVSKIRDFMTRDAKQPFCLVVALVDPHVPWVMGDPSQYPTDKLELPPNIADTERTRKDFGKYLAEITYMDSQVGEILQTLELAGEAQNTLVLFTSEQGSQFPGCKWTNWDTGVHTALMARWPGHVEPNRRTDALVQYADVVPTLLEACQVTSDDGSDFSLDGSSFMAVLKGESEQHRSYVFGMHNNVPEGPAYPIRSISDGEYHYIQNLLPEEIYIEKHLMGVKGKGLLNNPYWGTWVWESTEDARTYELVKRYMRRPSEQLYRLSDDRYEMNNLAEKTELANVKARLKQQLAEWMESQGDPGVEQDTFDSLQAARKNKHRFFPGR